MLVVRMLVIRILVVRALVIDLVVRLAIVDRIAEPTGAERIVRRG